MAFGPRVLPQEGFAAGSEHICRMVSEQAFSADRCSPAFSHRQRQSRAQQVTAAGKQISYQPHDPCWNGSKHMAIVSNLKLLLKKACPYCGVFTAVTERPLVAVLSERLTLVDSEQVLS